MKRKLFPGERELQSIGNITLTSHRVISHSQRGAVGTSRTILLENVEGTGLERVGPRRVLLLAVSLVLLVSIVSSSAVFVNLSVLLLLVPVGLAMLFLCFIEKTRLFLSIASSRTDIVIALDGQRWRETRDFLDRVDREAARARARASLMPPGVPQRERMLGSAEGGPVDA
ncbi:MAG: hypothetical protein AAGF11_06730 [Myxococcota bacterium]